MDPLGCRRQEAKLSLCWKLRGHTRLPGYRDGEHFDETLWLIDEGIDGGQLSQR